MQVWKIHKQQEVSLAGFENTWAEEISLGSTACKSLLQFVSNPSQQIKIHATTQTHMLQALL
jgi:hypothetical protein